MRLIDADELRQHMYHEAFETDTDMQRWDSGCWIRFKMFENAIEDAPTIEAEPVRHGRWIEDSNDKWRCSECGIGDMYAYSWDNDVGRKLQDYFCPHCGAKMDLEE